MASDKNSITKEAQKFAAKGQFNKAIAEWKKLLKETPNDPNIYNTIGDLCLKKDAKNDAVDAYTKAADILASDGFTSKAIALYKKVLNIDPKKIEVHLALGDMNAEKGLTGNALESYKLVADYYTKNKQTAKALGIYQKMADLNAQNVTFRLKLAEMYAKEGMKKEAIKAYLQAADIHVSKDAFKEARQIFEKTLALDPNNKDVYHKAGLVYFKEGKFTEACKTLKPAFEGDPENAELCELYLDALTRAGRGADAAEVYANLLARQPDRADLREKLFRLYLSEGEHDKAFSEVSTLANDKIENKDLDGAEEMLKSFVAEAPRHVGGKRALSALYKTVGKGGEAANVLVQAAGVLIEDGDRDGAKEVLSRAIELEPDQQEAKRLMESLEPQASAGTVQSQPAASEPSSLSLLDDPVISEALTEVDVLVKYGLQTKAIEQLERLAETNPRNIQIRIKLRDLHGDQGNMQKAAGHMLVLSDLYVEHGMQEKARQILQEALELNSNNEEIRAKLGMTEESGAPLADVTFDTADSTPVFEDGLQPPDQSAEMPVFDLPSGDAEEGFDLTGASGLELPVEEPAAPADVSEELSFDPPFSAPDSFETEQEQFSGEPAAEELPGQSLGTVPEQEEQGFGLNGQGDGMAAEEETAPVGTINSENDISEILAEAEFYYQQGLFDEAHKHYQKILQSDPGNVQARSRIVEIQKEQEDVQEFSKLVDGLDGLEAYSGSGEPAGEMAVSASDEEAVRSLMQEIAQLKEKSAPPKGKIPSAVPELARQGRPAAAPASTAARAEEDFSDLGTELSASAGPGSSAGEADFFDLASELRDELSSISVPPQSSGEDQSLDDIFEEFKKGVEQQAIKEDADSHYNLGIAYKEMGLLEDAIAEFAMTPEDEPKYVQSRHMLGLCYMEQGDYQNAIIELEQALMLGENSGLPVKDRMGMRYDLGFAYQGTGNSETALKEFQEVAAAYPDYRDVAGKIKELRQGEVISLEQLKDDIEKEISSKFIEEGERIEREEKTRKNEKVRG